MAAYVVRYPVRIGGRRREVGELVEAEASDVANLLEDGHIKAQEDPKAPAPSRPQGEGKGASNGKGKAKKGEGSAAAPLAALEGTTEGAASGSTDDASGADGGSATGSTAGTGDSAGNAEA